MKLFLKIKHWQLFGLLFGAPLIIQSISAGQIYRESKLGGLDFMFPILVLIYVTCSFGWFYSVGTNLYKLMPDGVRMNIERFRIFLVIPVVYVIFVVGFIGLISSNGEPGQEPPNIAYFVFWLLLHLFSMFCIFYCLYFNAKSLKTVELQREVGFSDYAGVFFLMWFFPIGVWLIQPRINELFKNM